MTRPGPQLAVAALMPLMPATADRPINGREPTAGGVTLGVRSAGLGQGRVVVSGADEAWTGRAVGLVTTRVDGSAAPSSGLYRHRWPPATCAQDRQGPLGCTASRRRSREARGTPGGVVCVASSRRHLTCRPAVPDRTQGRLHTRGDACRQPGRAWRPRLLGCVQDQWSHSAPVDQRCGQLCAKPRGMVPV